VFIHRAGHQSRLFATVTATSRQSPCDDVSFCDDVCGCLCFFVFCLFRCCVLFVSVFRACDYLFPNCLGPRAELFVLFGATGRRRGACGPRAVAAEFVATGLMFVCHGPNNNNNTNNNTQQQKATHKILRVFLPPTLHAYLYLYSSCGGGCWRLRPETPPTVRHGGPRVLFGDCPRLRQSPNTTCGQCFVCGCDEMRVDAISHASTTRTFFHPIYIRV
jgi:hypothetical protein